MEWEMAVRLMSSVVGLGVIVAAWVVVIEFRRTGAAVRRGVAMQADILGRIEAGHKAIEEMNLTLKVGATQKKIEDAAFHEELRLIAKTVGANGVNGVH